MSKKDKKKDVSMAADFQEVVSMIPRLESLVKIHTEISEGYLSYRKSGGAEIPGIERHLPFREKGCESCDTMKKKEKKKKSRSSEGIAGEDAKETKTKKTKKELPAE